MEEGSKVYFGSIVFTTVSVSFSSSFQANISMEENIIILLSLS